MTTHLESAYNCVREERRRVDDERTAFKTFLRRLDRITVESTNTQLSPSGMTVNTANTTGVPPKLQSAYESTVMAVPHYDIDYDEPFEVHFGAEFSDKLTAMLSVSPAFTPQLRGAVIAGAQKNYKERAEFVTRLDQELESLLTAQTEATSIYEKIEVNDHTPLSNRSFNELLALYALVCRQQDRLDELAVSRQHTIARVNHGINSNLVDLHTYLYDEPTFPVLAAIAELATTLHTAQYRIERELIYR